MSLKDAIRHNTSLLKSTMPRADIEQAKALAQIAAIKRHQKLGAWNDYIGFVFTKGVGLVAFVGGAASLIAPNFLPIHLQQNQAETAVGIGLALLAGNRVVDLVSRVVNGLK